MATRDDGSLWAQPALFLPDAIELVWRVGVVRESDHLQMQLEARSATDSELLALISSPHRSLSRTSSELRSMATRWNRMVTEVTSPFS